MSLMTVRLFLAAIVFAISSVFVFFSGGSLGACISVGAFCTLVFFITSMKYAGYERRKSRYRYEE
ncbi:MAG: hypothetical protein EON61_14515 [Alphaproteobacteria bacterium]|nr:MAG: hypothetical protein EON61_14515 [Alphaproteobacteria bacterium]